MIDERSEPRTISLLLRVSIWVLLCQIALFAIPTDGKGAQYYVEPSLGVRAEYNDNVLFRDVDDTEFRISPGLKVEAQTERTEIKAAAVLDVIEFLEYSELDHVDQKYDLSAAVTPTEVWQIGAFGTYIDDYTYRSALTESGLIADIAHRKAGFVEPFLSVNLSSRDTLRGEYTLSNVEFVDATYPDYQVHGGEIRWFHGLRNERSEIIFLVGGNLAEYDHTLGEVKQQTYRGMGGVEHEFTETLKTTVLAGGGYVESEYPRLEITPSLSSRVTTVKEDDTTFLIDATIRWEEERRTLYAGVSRDIDASIYGENIVRDRIRAGLEYKWTEDWAGNIKGSYYRSETKGIYQKEEWQTFSVVPQLRYHILENVHLSANYRYVWTENQITDLADDQNRVWIELSMAWPKTFD
jgi:hypothetical protein